MPVRIPAAKTTEIATYGVAGTMAFAPFYFMAPGAEERLAHQTTKWAPRWERNISHFTSPAERGIQRMEPHVERTVKKIDSKLPLERMAKASHKNLQSGFDKINARLTKQ